MKLREMGVDLFTPANGDYKALLVDTAAHVATNDENAVMTFLSLGEKELGEFQADWGMVCFFEPKDIFSERRHGELLVL